MSVSVLSCCYLTIFYYSFYIHRCLKLGIQILSAILILTYFPLYSRQYSYTICLYSNLSKVPSQNIEASFRTLQISIEPYSHVEQRIECAGIIFYSVAIVYGKSMTW